MAIKTFLDTGVLIVAWRGEAARKMRALTLLNDPRRAFVCSPFVKLELLPKTIYHRNQQEQEFYNDYFQLVDEWVEDFAAMYGEAMRSGEKHGLAAMDALHIAAASLAQADEFITAERPTSPFSRVQGMKITTIY